MISSILHCHIRPLRVMRVSPQRGATRLARLSLERNCSSDKRSRQNKMLERIPIAKLCQLLRSEFALRVSLVP